MASPSKGKSTIYFFLREKAFLLSFWENRNKIRDEGLAFLVILSEKIAPELRSLKLDLQRNEISSELLKEFISNCVVFEKLKSVKLNFQQNEELAMDKEEIMANFEKCTELETIDIQVKSAEE